eukprot:04107.XXX_111461_112151_1 [CDS] Oithona nana genome sequencing.
MWVRIVLLSILTTSLAYASLKSHMTPGHNTNTVLDKELHQMSKEEVGEENRELDTLVESYKIRIGNDIGKASLSLTEEQIDQAVIRIKALRANAAGFGESEDERRERIIRETKFRKRLLTEMGELGS